MATVQDLINIVDDKLHAYSPSALTTPGGTTAQDKKIRALNAGKHKVWQLLVGSGRAHRANWFGKKDATISFGIGSNSQALPNDFHDLLWAESTVVRMKAAAQHRTTWQEDRAESANIDMTTLGALYYLVSGDFQPALEISRKPTASLAVTIFYTAIIAEWSALADNIDKIPTPYFDAVCNWAVSELVTALHSPEVAQYWFQKWQDDKEMIIAATAQRNLGDVISTEGFDTAG